MVHYPILVALGPGEVLDDLMAPYDEARRGPPQLEMPWGEVETLKCRMSARPPRGRFLVHAPTHAEMNMKEFIAPQASDERGLLTTYSPLSRWDYFEVGGRWPDALLLRSGARVARAPRPEVVMPLDEPPAAFLSAWSGWLDALAAHDHLGARCELVLVDIHI